MFNIALILGLSACLRNLPVPKSSLRLDYPLMIVASIALILMSIPWGGGQGTINQIEGVILVAGLITFMFLAVKLGKVDADEVGEVEISGLGMPAAIGLIILGIALMAVGGDVALTGAVAIAETVGMSERVIGLTVVALGTSLSNWPPACKLPAAAKPPSPSPTSSAQPLQHPLHRRRRQHHHPHAGEREHPLLRLLLDDGLYPGPAATDATRPSHSPRRRDIPVDSAGGLCDHAADPGVWCGRGRGYWRERDLVCGAKVCRPSNLQRVAQAGNASQGSDTKVLSGVGFAVCQAKA